MNLQPNLIGPRFGLSPLRESDQEALFAAASDPKIWELHPIPDRYLPETFKLYFQGLIESKGALAIRDLTAQEIVGTSSFYDFNQKELSVVIGYTFLTRKYWGGSSNREIKKLMMDYAFSFVETCYFHVGANNLRSQMAMKKIGGVVCGQFEKVGFRGKVYRNLIFKIEKTDYRL